MGPSVPCQLLRAAFMLFTSPPWQVAVRAHAQVAEQLQWTHLLLHISKYFETEICLLHLLRFLSSCLAPSCWHLEMGCRRELFIWSFRFSEDSCFWHNSHWFLPTDTASSINQLLFSSVSLGFLNILLVCCQAHLFRCLVHGWEWGFRPSCRCLRLTYWTWGLPSSLALGRNWWLRNRNLGGRVIGQYKHCRQVTFSLLFDRFGRTSSSDLQKPGVFVSELPKGI